MRWYLYRSGNPEGPFDEQALVELIRSGQVGSAAQVCPEGGNAWQPVFSHPPFAQAGQGGASQPGASQHGAPQPGASQHGAPQPGASQHGAPQPQAQPQTPQQEHDSLPKTVPLSAHQLGQAAAPGGAGPGGPGAPGAPGAAAGAGAPPKKKSKLPLILGGGCGLLVVLTLCVGGGIFAYFEMKGGAFADETLAAAEDIMAAAEGRTGAVSATWTSSAGEESLLQTPPSEADELDELSGEPEMFAAAARLAGFAGNRAVYTIVLVFPDGTVRYSGLETRDYPADLLGPPENMPRTTEALTRMGKGVDEFLDLAAKDCEGIELVTEDDLEELPSKLGDEIMEHSRETDRDEVCSEVSSRGRTAFSVTRVEGVVVLMKGENGDVAGLRSSVKIPEGSMTDAYLTPVRVRLFD